MKCLHILPMNKLSGAEKLALILCKNLERYEPVVVCGGDNLKSIFETNAIKSYSVDFQNNNPLKTAKELSKIIKENEIKIVHAHDNNASVSAYLSKVLYTKKVKVISHIHNCYPWVKGKNKNKAIDSLLRKKYDHNIACGKLVFDYYKEHASYVNSKNTSILSNAIDIEEITNTNSSTAEIYKEFNIPKNKKIIGFIGRISDQKGIIPFINEFEKYKDKFEDSVILLVGNGDQDNLVKDLIKNKNLDEFFISTGYQENTYRFYPIIDIFFLPSLYEGLPMVILEAMSFKKPIVSMNVGSIDEVVKNGYNGYLINLGDYERFFNGLLELKNNKKQIKCYGENSFKIIQKNYNIKEYGKAIANVYDMVLK